MSELSQSELKQTARAYDDLLVPALFQGWADRMAALADLQTDSDVLDVACGTGVLTLAVKRHLGPDGSATGLDLNPGMLEVASGKEADVDWRQGNAESLPFDDRSFDVVVSQFGLMLFDSPEGAMREMWRVLRPGGRLYVAVFNSLDQLPAYATAADVYEHVVGPTIGNALRFPFSMGDVDELTALFRRAEISDPVVTTHAGEARFNNPRHMVLSDVKGWFPFAGFHLDDETIDKVERRLAEKLDEYIRPNGEVRFDVSVHVMEASKSENPD